MKLIAQLKLLPTSDQHAALLRTVEQANVVCNAISQTVWQSQTFKQFDVHTLVYDHIRATSGLSAQMVVRQIAKVADAYKIDRTVQRTFAPHGAISYDDRILSWNMHAPSVSIWTVNGRQSIPFVCGKRQWELLQSRRGETDLAYVNGQFYLLATCDVEEPTPDDVDRTIGVDLGIVNTSTDSDGETYSGAQIERVRQRYQRRRSALQAVGTKNAKRRLKSISGKQRRFQTNTNHTIAKRLVAKAKCTKRQIALEDLTHIRSRVKASGRQQRARHSNWSFNQLRQFVTYKAAIAGVRVVLVNPAYTSRTCSACGHCDKRNRKNQAVFCCVVCQFATSADYNAAINIERAVVTLPMASTLRR
ncbi:RNA-guided endonuclease InsQ/TnpB family protein [Herpetosiphon llansteffanensis]|uniref:RNA-guided endonuclease InsQ/TnpB family protein n=1 Tax=Herpetosiphon llansteffanensis TaxID=2094568 RepID=UPI000D7BD211|nr:RNA-guided endonuclease TnpB family protein [Herpetosiphon llansteffanensis]